VGEDYSGVGAAAGGAVLGEACIETSLDAARRSAYATMYWIVIISVAIGVVDVGGIFLLQHFGLLNEPSSLDAWAFMGAVLWVGAAGFGLYRWGIRSLWSLLGLPLVLFPVAVIGISAGMI
jgi:hypothetical protein